MLSHWVVMVMNGRVPCACFVCCTTEAVQATQFAAVMQQQAALQQKDFEIDCVAILQLRMHLLHHSPRACRLCHQRGDKVGYVA